MQPRSMSRLPALNTDQVDLLRVLSVLGTIVVIAAIASSGVFLQPANIVNVLQQNAILFVLAVAQFLVILTGGIDLSSGAVVALASVLFVSFLDYGVAVAALVALASGILVGILNGVLVTMLRLPSFVVSLGTTLIIYSLAKVFTGGGTVQGSMGGATIPAAVSSFYAQTLAGFPAPLVAFATVLGLVALYLRLLPGHLLYAIGGNARAARLAGAPVRAVRIAGYAISSSLAAFGGILFAARVGYGDPQAGVWLPLDAIAAVAIGGASLTGGRGTLAATVTGVLIIAVLNNAMNLVGAPPTLQPTIKGVIIILAVFVYMRRLD